MNEKQTGLRESLSKTISVNALMVLLSQYDGRFPVCFRDDKNNMIPLTAENIDMSEVNILLPNHTHISDVSAIVIEKP